MIEKRKQELREFIEWKSDVLKTGWHLESAQIAQDLLKCIEALEDIINSKDVAVSQSRSRAHEALALVAQSEEGK